MDRYKRVQYWLIAVFIIVFLGFGGYWSNFTSESFGHHLHMFSALAWFGLLMTQPRLAIRGSIAAHRRNGMIGLFVAGMVVASAALMMPANMQMAQTAKEGAFVGPAFLYGITFYDLVTVVAFGFCVIMAVLNSKRLHDHAAWMLASVYCILMPALARMLIFPLAMIVGFENLNFIKVLLVSAPLVLMVIAITAWRFKSLHPAWITAFVVNIPAFFVGPIGRNEWWRNFCDALFLEV